MLKLLEAFKFGIGTDQYLANSIDEINIEKNKIIIYNPEHIENWTIGFDGQNLGWFPMMMLKAIEEINNNDIRSEVNLENLEVITKELFSIETNFVKDFVINYKQIADFLIENPEFKDKKIVELLDACKRFLINYKNLLSSLDNNIKLTPDNRKIGSLYLEYLENIKVEILLYCELHSANMPTVSKYESEISEIMHKKNEEDNSSIVSFFSMPFTKFIESSIALEELANHAEGTKDYLDCKKAILLYKLIEFSTKDLRKILVERNNIIDLIEDKYKITEDILYIFQVFIYLPQNSIEKYMILQNNKICFLAKTLSKNQELEKIIIENIYIINDIEIGNLPDTDEIYNAINITIGDEKIVVLFGEVDGKNIFNDIYKEIKTNKVYVPFWRKHIQPKNNQENKRNIRRSNTTQIRKVSTNITKAPETPNVDNERLKIIEQKLNIIISELRMMKSEISQVKLALNEKNENKF